MYIYTYGLWLMTMGSFRRELTSSPTISPRHHVGRRQVDYVEFCHHLGSCKKRDPLMMSSLTRWRWTFTLETVGCGMRLVNQNGEYNWDVMKSPYPT